MTKVFGQLELVPEGWEGSFTKSSFEVEVDSSKPAKEVVNTFLVKLQQVGVDAVRQFMLEDQNRKGKLKLTQVAAGVMITLCDPDGYRVKETYVKGDLNHTPRVVIFGRRIYLRYDLDGFTGTEYRELGIDNLMGDYFTYVKE